MALTPGTRLGHYEILSAIGAGGMGEVYRARDSRLDREVAVKVLSSEMAQDPTALARFEREALSVAKLSHPNILAIYEFAHDQGHAFVVTELVDGETMRARLDTGPLASRRAVTYALQIARGMAAAHGRGIAHRDLKPENVMITRDDQVKILDFGLAKPLDAGGTDVTRDGGAVTNAGTILGTFGYMAPEQVRGLAVDHRADIFACGAVLYEMLSGQRAFKGDTAADTMSAVLTKDPANLETSRLSIPLSLDRIVRRCLEKSPELRFQSASDLAFALETLATASSSSSPAEAAAAGVPAYRGARLPWLGWAVAAITVLAGAALWWRSSAPLPEPRWSHFTRITEAAGEETSPTLSPDGSTVAYAVRVNGNWDVYAPRVGGRNATPIVNDPERHEAGPAFSPDGSRIAFHEADLDGGIFVAGATGESVRRVTDIGFEPAWSPDGTQIAFATEEIVDPASRLGDSTLQVVPVSGGTPRRTVGGDAVQPVWSPSGARIVFWSNTGGQRDLFTVAASGGTRVPLTQDPAIDWSPAWSPDGRYVYFSSDRGAAMNVWRIAVDEASGRTLGAPEPVTAGVQAAAGFPRFSKDGTRLAFRSRVASVNPVAIPFDPVALRAGTPVILDARNSVRIPSDVSPDGSQIAYFNLADQQEDLFIGAPMGPTRRVTDDPQRDRGPVFTPDGRSLVFYSNRDGDWATWAIGVDGGNLRKVSGPDDGDNYPVVSPKGDAVISGSTKEQTLLMAPLAPVPGMPATALPGTTTGRAYLTPMSWSADAKRLAGMLYPSFGWRASGIALYDLDRSMTTKVSDDETGCVRWLADGRRIIYFASDGSELVVLDTQTRTRTVIDVRLPAPSINEVFAISPDNRTIYYGAARAEADIDRRAEVTRAARGARAAYRAVPAGSRNAISSPE